MLIGERRSSAEGPSRGFRPAPLEGATSGTACQVAGRSAVPTIDYCRRYSRGRPVPATLRLRLTVCPGPSRRTSPSFARPLAARGRGHRPALRAIEGYGPMAGSQRTWGFVPDGVLRIPSQDANPGAGQQEDAHVMANAENGLVAPEMTGTQPVAPGRTRSGKPAGPAFKPMHHEDMDPQDFAAMLG